MDYCNLIANLPSINLNLYNFTFALNKYVTILIV